MPMGVALWEARQYQDPQFSGPGALIDLVNIVSHVVIMEVNIAGSTRWATITMKQVLLNKHKRHKCYFLADYLLTE